MKKNLKIAFVLMLLLLLVGCGAKEDEEEKTKDNTKAKDGIRVVCSMSETEEGIKSEATIASNFKKSDNSFVSFDLDVNMDYSEGLKDLSDKEKEEATETMGEMVDFLKESFKKEFGVELCDGSNKNSKLNITCKATLEDLKKASDSEIEFDEKTTQEDFTKEMEKQGYTCKTEEISLEK